MNNLGNVAKNTFEAINFLFVSHPFDVGDRVVVNGDILSVHKINITATLLRTVDEQLIYYPNTILATKPIRNLRRSGGE